MAKEPESATKRIQPTHGVYRGTQIDLPTADAEAAISDGWAIDPFAPVDPKAEPKEFSQEDHDKATEAADKAARKIRGEPEPEPEKKHSTRAAHADESGEGSTYQTRRTAPASSAPAPAKPKT